MKKQRDETLDILKGLAIVAVVGIHVIAHQKLTYPLVALDQVFRFCVPVFVAVSGFALARKYWDEINLIEYLQKRVWRILPLYFLWCGISIYFNESGYPLWEKILLGRADYHLYFVPMIIQLYLLFPILLFLVKKLAWPTLFVSLIWQVYLFNSYSSTYLSDQQQYVLFSSWIFYFILGMIMVKHKSRFGLILLGSGLIWTLQNTFSQIGKVDPIVVTRFTKLPILLYATGWILAGEYFKKLKVFAFLGQHSYLIYLAHVLVLKLYWGQISNWFVVVLGIGVSLLLASPPKLWAKAWK